MCECMCVGCYFSKPSCSLQSLKSILIGCGSKLLIYLNYFIYPQKEQYTLKKCSLLKIEINSS